VTTWAATRRLPTTTCRYLYVRTCRAGQRRRTGGTHGRCPPQRAFRHRALSRWAQPNCPSTSAPVNCPHASRPTAAHGSSGSLESRTAMRGPFLATSTQLLPDASEYDDLSHFNSGKTASFYRSLAISRMMSLDCLGFNALCSTASRRRWKFASCVDESKKTAPVGESTCTVSR